MLQQYEAYPEGVESLKPTNHLLIFGRRSFHSFEFSLTSGSPLVRVSAPILRLKHHLTEIDLPSLIELKKWI